MSFYGMGNPAHGYWSEKETNWSEEDTAFIDNVLKKNNKAISTSLKEIKEKHDSLKY